MKYFAVILVSLLFVNLSFQYVIFNDGCSDEQKALYGSTDGCAAVTCNTNAKGVTTFSAVGCASWLCGEGIKGYKKANNSLAYPECCSGPICS